MTLNDTKTKPLYLTDKKEWEKWFPADFITESFPGQFKNWFYSLIAMSTVLEDTNPMKTVLGFGTMLDEKGEAFHKSQREIQLNLMKALTKLELMLCAGCLPEPILQKICFLGIKWPMK